MGTDSVFERLKAFPKDGTKKGFWDTEKGQEGKVVSDGFDRITFDPQIMGGRACVRGMRIPRQ